MDASIFKEKLIAEKGELEKELATVGRRNPANPADWEAVPADTDIAPSDRDEVAEKLETFEENIAIVRQLEARLEEVKTALGRIEHGTYGRCVACRGAIETERLLANPAAATCKQHMK